MGQTNSQLAECQQMEGCDQGQSINVEGRTESGLPTLI